MKTLIWLLGAPLVFKGIEYVTWLETHRIPSYSTEEISTAVAIWLFVALMFHTSEN